MRATPSLALSLASGLVLSVLVGGCAFIGSPSRPIRASLVRHGGPYVTGSCLLVMIPGIGDTQERLLSEGHFASWSEASQCDWVMVDATFGYYRLQSLAERVREDILIPARQRGYQQIWLIGYSLGGLGAIWSASQSPGRVDGLVLMSPMLGVPPRVRPLTDEIRAAGGLRSWEPGAPVASIHPMRESRWLWQWLRDTIVAGELPVVLAYGRDDDVVHSLDLLAAALPPDRVITVAGGHGWRAWDELARIVAGRMPWHA